MKIFLLVAVFACIALIEVPGLIKNNQTKELKAFSFILLLGFILNFFQVSGIKLPNPNHWITETIKLIFPISWL